MFFVHWLQDDIECLNDGYAVEKLLKFSSLQQTEEFLRVLVNSPFTMGIHVEKIDFAY